MATQAKCVRLTASFQALARCTRPHARCFSSARRLCTDGVYSELDEMRTQIPFIEALKNKPHHGEHKSIPSPQGNVHRDLTPKRSSHKVVSSHLGHIRLGTLFMDLDALAGVIAYKHTGDSVMTVTAAVDRITLKAPLSEICDLELSGEVTFATGRSSLEISIDVKKYSENEVDDEKDILLSCAFTMVSLDPATKKPVAIAPLLTTTQEEKVLFALGEKNYLAKRAASKLALRKQTPNDEESDLIHALWLAQVDYHDPNTASRKPASVFYMKDTKISSVQIMQPQYRNRHNFMIFGGFLLKTTFELAFTCASAFSHSRPAFVALDPSTFQNPVPVGSVLYLTATVAYSDSPLVDSNDVKASPEGSSRIQIRVDSKVRNIEHGETKSTGTFNYTFEVKKDLKIIPESYEEFMIWLDARRRVNKSVDVESKTGGVME